MKQNFRYEGERDSKKKQNIQECIEYIMQQVYGVTITNETFAKILQYNIDDEEEYHKFKTFMCKVKNIVLQYGRVLKSISGIGYYILKPSQVSSHCYRTYIKSANKIVEKSDYVLSKVDETMLNDIRKEELENMVELNKQLIENMRNTIRESAYYDRKAYYDSLEN